MIKQGMNNRGPSCSGKTTVTRILKRVFKHVEIIYQDDFYKREEEIPIDSVTGLANWDCPESIDFDRFLNMIVETKRGGRISIDFQSKEELNVHDGSGQMEDIAGLKVLAAGLDEYRFVLVDGFMLYKDPRVYRELDCHLSLTASYETLKKRREAREGYHTTEFYWVDPPGYFDLIVWPEYQRLCQHDCLLDTVQTLDTDQHTIESMMLVALETIKKSLG